MPLRIFIILALLLLYLATLFLQPVLEGNTGSGRLFRYQNPLPAGLSQKLGVPASPDIDSVILAGPFSSWKPDNEQYRMEKKTGKNGKTVWSIRIVLPPGIDQYKFVLHLRDGSKIWTHDRSSLLKTDDGYGGYNSQAVVLDWAGYNKAFSGFLLGVFLILLFYSLIQLMAKGIFRMELESRQRYLLLLTLTLLLSNVLQYYYNLDAKRRTSMEGYIDIINTVHNHLMVSASDLARLSDTTVRSNLNATLEVFFRGLQRRFPDDRVYNRRVSYESFSVLDMDLHVVASARRGDLGTMTAESAARLGITNLCEFEERVMLKSVIDGLRKKGKEFQAWSTGQQAKNLQSYLSIDRKLKTLLLGYSAVVSPVFSGGVQTGYYVLGLHPDIAGGILLGNVIFNIIWNLALVMVILILFVYRPKAAVEDRQQIVHFTAKFGLTKREQEIIPLIMSGMSNASIAAKMFLSEKTIKSHIYRIYEKCGVDNRVGLINRIREQE